jgi:hypothetical protein
MDKIDQLKLNMSFGELEYLKIDLDYKSQLMSEFESGFLISVSNYLDDYPDIKNRYDKKNTNEFVESLEEKIIEIEKIKEEERQKDIEYQEDLDKDVDDNKEEDFVDIKKDNVESKPQKDPLLKNLYRKIVKKTHPDKVDDKIKNSYYTDATDAYDTNDIFTIYLICNKLDIEYVMKLQDSEKLHNQIGTINNEINMIESTFPWKWGETNEDQIRLALVKAFILQRMG